MLTYYNNAGKKLRIDPKDFHEDYYHKYGNKAARKFRKALNDPDAKVKYHPVYYRIGRYSIFATNGTAAGDCYIARRWPKESLSADQRKRRRSDLRKNPEYFAIVQGETYKRHSHLLALIAKAHPHFDGLMKAISSERKLYKLIGREWDY